MSCNPQRECFGSLENERKRREKRENQTLTESCGIYLHKIKVAKRLLRVTKLGGGGGGGGGGGAYIGHPMCETTRKPNVLANTRDKEVINKNGVVSH